MGHCISLFLLFERQILVSSSLVFHYFFDVFEIRFSSCIGSFSFLALLTN